MRKRFRRKYNCQEEKIIPLGIRTETFDNKVGVNVYGSTALNGETFLW